MGHKPHSRHPHRPAVHPLLPQAVAHHQAGRTAEAAEVYQRILAQVPRHFDATHLLGVIALQEDRLDEAERLISAALQINPKDPGALSNRGTVRLRKGELQAACTDLERALKSAPNALPALINLGTVLHGLDRYREAVVPLRKAYAADPKSLPVCNLLAACLLETGDASGAVPLFESITQAEPSNADAWSNLAVALNGCGEHVRAEECAARAAALNPDSPAAHAALAAALMEKNQVEAALASFRDAVALPDAKAATHFAYGSALLSAGRYEEAAAQFRRAIELDANHAPARWKLASAQCRPVFRTATEIYDARQSFTDCLADLKRWFEAAKPPDAYAAVGSAQPFYLAYHPLNNKDLLRQYGNLCGEWMSTLADRPSPRRKRKPGKGPPAAQKMRVGIASAHIRDHSVWNAITKGWLRHLDKARFEVHLFHLGDSSDRETEQARHLGAHFDDQPKGLKAWVRSISEADLDALLYPEIGMDPLTTQLASLRLAPVQAVAWGHPETSGLPTMDHYISAEAFEPADAQNNYSERLIALPNLGVYAEPLTPAVSNPDFDSLELPSDQPLLLCPGTAYKYSPIHDRVWVSIAKGLREAKSGRLVFFRGRFAAMDELFERRLRKAFEHERVKFDATVCVVDFIQRPQFFGLMQHSALMLDTLGFSGFNTAMQAVECGLPVLAYEGEFMRGRFASGIMRRMGLPELIAATDDEFIQKATALAADPARLQRLRREIADRRSMLFHDQEPIRRLEQALAEAIAQSERG